MEEERKTASGIVIPDSATKNLIKVKSRLVGKARPAMTANYRPMNVKVGDRICSVNMPANVQDGWPEYITCAKMTSSPSLKRK